MDLGLVGQAVGMFAVTNIDDLLVLVLFFGQVAGNGGAVTPVVAGQYLGFAAILSASILGAVGANLLPASAIPYLGLLPLTLGVRAAWTAWRDRGGGWDAEQARPVSGEAGPRVWQVTAVTLANGGDNIAVYVPVFAVAGAGGMAVYTAVFLVGVALWCAAARFLATRPVIARALARWGQHPATDRADRYRPGHPRRRCRGRPVVGSDRSCPCDRRGPKWWVRMHRQWGRAAELSGLGPGWVGWWRGPWGSSQSGSPALSAEAVSST